MKNLFLSVAFFAVVALVACSSNSGPVQTIVKEMNSELSNIKGPNLVFEKAYIEKENVVVEFSLRDHIEYYNMQEEYEQADEIERAEQKRDWIKKFKNAVTFDPANPNYNEYKYVWNDDRKAILRENKYNVIVRVIQQESQFKLDCEIPYTDF